MIRWRVLVVRAHNGKPKVGERVVQETSGARENGVCVCKCALCVPECGGPRAIAFSPQLKPRDEVKSGNESREGLHVTGHKGTIYAEMGKFVVVGICGEIC